jgi:hypothetical protein
VLRRALRRIRSNAEFRGSAKLIISPSFACNLRPQRCNRPTRRLHASSIVDSFPRGASGRRDRRSNDSLWRRQLLFGVQIHEFLLQHEREFELGFGFELWFELWFELEFEFEFEFGRRLDRIGRVLLQ